MTKGEQNMLKINEHLLPPPNDLHPGWEIFELWNEEGKILMEAAQHDPA